MPGGAPLLGLAGCQEGSSDADLLATNIARMPGSTRANMALIDLDLQLERLPMYLDLAPRSTV